MAVRLEPIILELEREQNDLLIIAHESVLRVLYGYLMACQAADIPFLSFPRDQIIEVRQSVFLPTMTCSLLLQIIPASYQNEAKQIQIPDLPEELIPGSPEGLAMPAPPSGFATPSGLGSAIGSPRLGSQRGSPKDGSRTPEAGYKTPEDNDLPSRIHDVI